MGYQTLLPLLVGGIIAIFVFAVGSAFKVWFKRNQSASGMQAASFSASLLKLAVSAAVVFIFVFAVNALQPKTLLEAEGLLVGKDLFAVRNRAGFTAEYPAPDPESDEPTAQYVKQGEVLVAFRPNLDHRELAAASLRKNILQEELNLERIRLPALDPTLQNQLQTLERQIDILNQREKDLIQQHEDYQRQVVQHTAAGNTEYRQVEQQLITIRSQIKQTQVSLENAGLQMRSALQLFERGLIPKNEKSSRIAAFNILQSKLDELKEREGLLQKEKAELRTNLAEARQKERELIATLTRWQNEAKTAKEHAVAEHAEVAKRLGQESAHAGERQLSRVRQIELQLTEVNQLLSDPASPDRIKVAAPWEGYVGYRDLSPASLKPDAGPLMVLYKPDHIWVQLPVTRQAAQALANDHANVKIWIPDAAAGQTEFSGRLEQKTALADGSHVELRISTAPPPPLVRKLAMGEELRARVKFSSKGFSAAGMFKLIPGFALIYRHAWLRVVLILAVFNAFLGLLIIGFIKLRNRRTRGPDWHAPESNALVIAPSGYAQSSTHPQAYARDETPQLSNPAERAGFVYNFTQDADEAHSGRIGIRLQEVSRSSDSGQALQPDFSDWWDLGQKLNRSILNHDADFPLLADLFTQIARQGIWVTPFIASALSAQITADLLLGYSMKLSVKRLSAVRRKAELGPAVDDLAHYFCVLQQLFPSLFQQIIPHLQQGLNRALQIAFAEVKGDPEMDHWLNMLRELLPNFGDSCPQMCLGLAPRTTSTGLLS